MKIIFLLPLMLSSCYLANGSPSSYNYWLKDDKVITYNDIQFCESKVYFTLGERFKYLLKMKLEKGWILMRENYRHEYDEYITYIKNASPQISQCYYDLGYRFTAPYYWCLAPDSKGNFKTCEINQKYR
ncbi:Uncharacterised protein [[Pasteurella] mairii]|uniref:Lipoprotein n=1 Tax=[Pasteurella] mairii TaxID=757 RepID=A0A379B869_9PAST|nr:Uncharacterised protein [[Pasteurella] mairii]